MTEATDTTCTLSLSSLMVGAKSNYDEEHLKTYGKGAKNDVKVDRRTLQPLGGDTLRYIMDAPSDSTGLVDVEMDAAEWDRWIRCATSIRTAIKGRQNDMIRSKHGISPALRSGMTAKFTALTKDRETLRQAIDLSETGYDVLLTANGLGLAVDGEYGKVSSTSASSELIPTVRPSRLSLR